MNPSSRTRSETARICSAVASLCIVMTIGEIAPAIVALSLLLHHVCKAYLDVGKADGTYALSVLVANHLGVGVAGRLCVDLHAPLDDVHDPILGHAARRVEPLLDAAID